MMQLQSYNVITCVRCFDVRNQILTQINQPRLSRLNFLIFFTMPRKAAAPVSTDGTEPRRSARIKDIPREDAPVAAPKKAPAKPRAKKEKPEGDDEEHAPKPRGRKRKAPEKDVEDEASSDADADEPPAKKASSCLRVLKAQKLTAIFFRLNLLPKLLSLPPRPLSLLPRRSPPPKLQPNQHQRLLQPNRHQKRLRSNPFLRLVQPSQNQPPRNPPQELGLVSLSPRFDFSLPPRVFKVTF